MAESPFALIHPPFLPPSHPTSAQLRRVASIPPPERRKKPLQTISATERLDILSTSGNSLTHGSRFLFFFVFLTRPALLLSVEHSDGSLVFRFGVAADVATRGFSRGGMPEQREETCAECSCLEMLQLQEAEREKKVVSLGSDEISRGVEEERGGRGEWEQIRGASVVDEDEILLVRDIVSEEGSMDDSRDGVSDSSALASYNGNEIEGKNIMEESSEVKFTMGKNIMS